MSFPWESIKADESRIDLFCYSIVFKKPIFCVSRAYAKKHYLT